MAYTASFVDRLDIGSVPLVTPAWTHTNLADLLSFASTRGENRILPGAIGVRPLRRRPTETTHTINLTVFGDYAPDGTVNADPVAGLWANLADLVTNVVDPGVNSTSTRTATLRFGGTVRTSACQVVGFEVGEYLNQFVVNASMDVTFIDGGFWT
jgi:hypothetical protein